MCRGQGRALGRGRGDVTLCWEAYGSSLSKATEVQGCGEIIRILKLYHICCFLCKGSDTTERLHFHFSFHALEKAMATHSSVLAWMYAGQEAQVRTGLGTTDWFQIGKGVRQGCHPAHLTYMQSTS